MDVKNILRVFRYGELQAKAERDPEAKRPPTIKFLVLVLGLAIVLISFWYGQRSGGADDTAAALTVPNDGAVNTTAPAPGTGSKPSAQQPPQGSVAARDD